MQHLGAGLCGYPTMRLFRQREWGNWHGVFAEIKKALCERLQAPRTDGVDLPEMERT
jgi:hypothetical protein